MHRYVKDFKTGVVGRVVLASLLGLVMSGCTVLTSFNECDVDADCAPLQGDGAVCSAGICEVPELPRVDVSGVISTDTLWTADKVWVLKDIVTVSPSVQLTIEAGTTIVGDRHSALVVRSGGRLIARGSRELPIVFSSSKDEGQRKSGDWGGVALLGRASVNRPNATLNILPNQEDSQFGGGDDAWNCGVLEYVRIEFAGGQVEGEEALNGLTFAGCGSGTSVDYVQIHYGDDDGLELFGGTVNINHILVTRPQDDGVDIDLGWRGRGQFIAVQMDAGGDNAIEVDNLGEDPLATPLTDFQIYNYTLIGDRDFGHSRGITFKAGGTGSLSHGIILGHRLEAIDVFGVDSGNLALMDRMEVARTLFYDIGPDVAMGQPAQYFPVAGQEGEVDPETMTGDDDNGLSESEFFRSSKFNNIFDVDPLMPDAHDLLDPNFLPAVVTSTGQPAPPSPEFNPIGVYLGAFSPGSIPWTDGWASFPGS